MNLRKKMKLFICNQGKHRSKTASELFNGEYVGIYSEEKPLTKELLDKSTIIYVFEEHQRKFIAENFPKQYLSKKIVCLDIPDIYNYMDEKLIEKMKEIL